MEELKKTKEILKLARNGRDLREFVSDRLPQIREEVRNHGASGYDKHNDGFSLNEEPCQSLVLRICYKSFTGSYGSSSTYSDIVNLDMDVLKQYLVKFLNKHKDEILLEMAEMMLSDAKEKQEVAIDEIESMKASLSALLVDIEK